ncbi:MAG: ribosome-binding factor A [Dehalococcoidia bacterium]|nr:ribosome-binding factor A [Dehalococcoidia bacterium]MQG16243.1 30S ribosome-binding factor RbfA [SAR202 cluster bacterium]|tara:strand:+ start:29830 stop:30198 length:369 start_codon:yes stop_codon:yes gene_type:complete
MTWRIDRVNSTLRQEISSIILTVLKDPRLTSLVSVIDVDTAKDLRSAKVYISIYGDTETKKSTIKALNNASGFISKNISNKLKIKSTPKLKFRIDNSLAQGSLLSEKISQIVTAYEDDKKQT